MLGLLKRLLGYEETHPADLLCTRSPEWPKVRAHHLKKHPKCEVCGSTVNVVPHHIVPVQCDKSLELIEDNLVSLCENRFHCHLLVGHLGLFSSWNVTVRSDAAKWREKIINRPKA